MSLRWASARRGSGRTRTCARRGSWLRWAKPCWCRPRRGPARPRSSAASARSSAAGITARSSGSACSANRSSSGAQAVGAPAGVVVAEEERRRVPGAASSAADGIEPVITSETRAGASRDARRRAASDMERMRHDLANPEPIVGACVRQATHGRRLRSPCCGPSRTPGWPRWRATGTSGRSRRSSSATGARCCATGAALLGEARAEDVVQQALLAAWAALRRGDDVRDLRPWLHRIVHNTALNALRGGRDELRRAARVDRRSATRPRRRSSAA